MSITIADAGSKIINTASGTVAAGVDIEGGYFVIDSLDKIPDHANVIGALCFVLGTVETPINKFYQYGTSGWLEAKLSSEPLIEITYTELLDLRDDEKLIPGQQYRITNYTTTTTQDETNSAANVFDIIVTADSNNILNENARAIQHEGDSIFAESDLAAWEIKYCLDNDISRFTWADEESGTGVIYYMKDEYNNEAHYDFKNIRFSRKVTQDGELNLETGVNNWCYTFGGLIDRSRKKWLSNDGENLHVYNNNSIGTCYTGCDEAYSLPNNVFLSYCGQTPSECMSKNNKLGPNCSENTFENGCQNIVLGDSCCNNTFWKSCSNISLRDICNNNIFGDDCNRVTLGDQCSANSFKNGCNNISFMCCCSSNIVEENCSVITFGKSCDDNIIGASSENISFGDYCVENSFAHDWNNLVVLGSGCVNNTFGEECCNIVFGTNCEGNVLGNTCQYITFGNSCSNNIFGFNPSRITFGNDCNDNVFGESFHCVTLGNNCYGNTFTDHREELLEYCEKITLDSDVSYINLWADDIDIENGAFQNIVIHKGIEGSSTTNRLSIYLEDRGSEELTEFYKSGSKEKFI